MDYLLQYVFTEREYTKIVHLLSSKELGPPAEPSERTKEIRAFVRLFGKVYLAGFALNRLTRVKVSARSLATALVACAASYRVLYRLLGRLKQRFPSIPRVSIPAVAGAIAGYILSRGLPHGINIYAAVYFLTKLCEWTFNAADDQHLLEWKPRILGTWILFPFAFSQLFHSLIMSPENCPNGFKRLMTLLSNGSLKSRQTEDDVLHGVADAVSHQFPIFRSSLVYENNVNTEDLLLRAHPGNTSAVSALLHPQTDSDLEYFSDTVSANMGLFAKYLLPLYLARAYMGEKPMSKALADAFRTALVYSMTSASALAGIQLSQQLLGRKLPPAIRLRIIGLLSGLWAICNQGSGRAQFLYAVRLAVLSAIPRRMSSKVSDVVLPVAFAGTFVLMNTHPEAITQRFYRKMGNWVQKGQWAFSTKNKAVSKTPTTESTDASKLN